VPPLAAALGFSCEGLTAASTGRCIMLAMQCSAGHCTMAARLHIHGTTVYCETCIVSTRRCSAPRAVLTAAHQLKGRTRTFSKNTHICHVPALTHNVNAGRRIAGGSSGSNRHSRCQLPCTSRRKTCQRAVVLLLACIYMVPPCTARRVTCQRDVALLLKRCLRRPIN